VGPAPQANENRRSLTLGRSNQPIIVIAANAAIWTGSAVHRNSSFPNIDLKKFGLRLSSAVLICIFPLSVGMWVSFPVHGYCGLVAID
jgi:hypothetical protein